MAELAIDLTDEEKYALAIWGSEKYAPTLARLEQVAGLTVDQTVRDVIISLHDKLTNELTVRDYIRLYGTARGVTYYERDKYKEWRKRKRRDFQKAVQYAADRGWLVLKGGKENDHE